MLGDGEYGSKTRPGGRRMEKEVIASVFPGSGMSTDQAQTR